MDIIKNNPYRILGLLAGATAKEQNRQISRLKQYIEAEQEPPADDFSFPALGEFTRTVESIEEAASKLNLDDDKVNAALFWFWNGNPITDEVAFDALREGDIDKAYEIWSRLSVKQSDLDGAFYLSNINEKNFSAHHNLFVLENIVDKYKQDKISPRNLAVSYLMGCCRDMTISANLILVESKYSHKFFSDVVGERYTYDVNEIQLRILDEFAKEDYKNKSGNLKSIVVRLKSYDFAKELINEFVSSVSRKYINDISEQIENAKKKRLANIENAAIAGKELYGQTRNLDLEKKLLWDKMQTNKLTKEERGLLFGTNEVELLKAFVGSKDIVFTNIVDKIAEEILQCGIDHFNYYKDTETDPSSVSLNLFDKAKSIAVGDLQKQRIEENIEGLKEWQEQSKVKPYIESLISKLEEFEEVFIGIKTLSDRLVMIGGGFLMATPYTKRLDDIIEFIESSKSDLLAIKTILNGSSDLYLGLSVRIAGKAQELVVKEVNDAQSSFNFRASSSLTDQISYNSYKDELQKVMTKAWKVTELIGSFDMLRDFQSHYRKNKETLKNICNQIGASTPKYNFPKIPQLNFLIKSSTIRNTDKNSNPLRVTYPLYDKYVRCLGLDLEIECIREQDVVFYLRYFDPNNNYGHSAGVSPKGYTTSTKLSIDNSTTKVSLRGWGNNDKCSFEVGAHKIKVFVEDYMIYEKEFTVDLAPSQKLELEIKDEENKLEEIKKFQLFRLNSTRERQILEQEKAIKELKIALKKINESV